MSDRQLSLQGLGVDFGARTALEDITMIVPADRPVAVTGPSGAGKTVLLHTVAGLLAPTRGTVLLDGRALVVGDDGRCIVGVVLQSHGLASGLTAEENIALPLQARVFTLMRRRGGAGRRWPPSTWTEPPAGRSTTCREANASGSAWPVPWRWSRTSWWRMSPRRNWIPPTAPGCSPSCSTGPRAGSFS